MSSNIYQPRIRVAIDFDNDGFLDLDYGTPNNSKNLVHSGRIIRTTQDNFLIIRQNYRSFLNTIYFITVLDLNNEIILNRTPDFAVINNGSLPQRFKVRIEYYYEDTYQTVTTQTFTKQTVITLQSASIASVTINDVPNGNELTNVTLGATLGIGTYDDITYNWTVSHGTLDDNTASNPIWSRPDVASSRNATISLTVTVTGDGTNARNNTRDTATDTEVTRIIHIAPLPNANIASVTINTIPAANEGTTVRLSAMLGAGTYDNITYQWSANGGVFNDSTLASPIWTRPDVTTNTVHTISLTVTVTGDGSTSRNGSRDTATDTERTTVRNFVPLPVASIASVSIDTVPPGSEGTQTTLKATIGNGIYDRLVYDWTVSGGTLNDASAVSPVWTRPAVTANTTHTIGLTVTAEGTGIVARNNTSQELDATDVTSVTINVTLLPASISGVTIPNIPDGNESTSIRITGLTFTARYDVIEYNWETTHGTFNSNTIPSPTWNRPAVTTDTDVTISLTITVRGAGTFALDNTSATDSDTEVTTVNNIVLPNAVVTSVVIDSVPDGVEETEEQLGATVVGTYDRISYLWRALSGGVAFGTFDDSTIATPTWTRPAVDADTEASINLTVQGSGDGVLAELGTSSTLAATAVTTEVTDTVAPSLVGIDFQMMINRRNNNTFYRDGDTVNHGANAFTLEAIDGVSIENIFWTSFGCIIRPNTGTQRSAWETYVFRTDKSIYIAWGTNVREFVFGAQVSRTSVSPFWTSPARPSSVTGTIEMGIIFADSGQSALALLHFQDDLGE